MKKPPVQYALVLSFLLLLSCAASGQTVKEHFLRAMEAQRTGNPTLAITEFTTAIQLDPQFHHAYYNRGLIYASTGNLDLAIIDYTKTIEIKPDFFPAYNNRGDIYLGRNQLDNAFSDFSKALELDPNSALALMNRGSVYMKRGMFTEAVADYERSAKLDPKQALVFHNLGTLYFRSENWSAAVNNLTRSAQLDPSLLLAHYKLMWAHLIAGNYEQVPLAAAKCIAAKDVENDRANWCSTIGYLGWLRAGKPAEAEAFLKQSAPPTEIRNSSPLTIKEYLRGKLSEKALFEKYATSKFGLMAAHTFVGEVELAKGNTAAALEHFRAADQFGIKDSMEATLARAEFRRLSDK